MDKMFYNAKDVSEILSVSIPTAYKVIKQLNYDLNAKGYLTISGRVPVLYFNEKMYCSRTENVLE